MAPSHNTRDTLWTLISAPAIWAAHFLLSYVGAAYVCAPNSAIFREIGTIRAGIGVLTLLALLATGLIFARAWREWRSHGAGTVNDEDTDSAREAFLEFSTVLLAALSFVAILFVALPALFIADCR